MNKLTAIQSEIKVPKENRNDFGKYNYRSFEDIVTQLKPLLIKNNCHLIVKDEIVQIGQRYYVKATAELYDDVNNALIGSSSAYARESEDKKGVIDSSMITGAASSYARKYALSGLVLCDNAKDADALTPQDYHPIEYKQIDKQQEVLNQIEILKRNNINLAQKFSGELRDKILVTINDPRFHSINGQQSLAQRINQLLEKLPGTLPLSNPKPTSVKEARFSLGGKTNS